LFTNSAVYDYIEAFYVGFQFDKYSYGEECFVDTSNSLDTLYNFNIEMIQRYTWADPFLYTSQQIATDINDSWFNCWQFQVDFKAAFWEKKANFVDLPDFYLSFIFNLLGNSFQIKSATESMIDSAALHDTVTYYQSFGYLLQIMYDFESYKTTSASLVSFMTNASKSHGELKGVPPKMLRESKRHETKLA